MNSFGVEFLYLVQDVVLVVQNVLIESAAVPLRYTFFEFGFSAK